MSATPDQFEQLTGPFDRPVAPSPAFAERLRLTVQERAGVSIAATNEDRASIRETPTQIPSSRRHPAPGRGTRWSSRIAAAILVLLLAGLAISLARLQTTPLTGQHDVGDGNGGNPVPASPGFDGNWGGGTGHTWAFDLPAFGTGQVTIGQGGETSSLASAQSMVTNGSIIVSLRPMAPNGPATLEAFTLTGNPRWQVSIGAMPGMAIDNDRLYIIRDNIDGDGTRPLTTISLETGDVLWTGPDLASTGKATWGWSPIVANGVVYVANQKGGAYALDAQTGKQRWEAPIADDAPPKRADGSSETQTGGSIALGKDGLWVAGWTNTIRKLDPATGKVLATISLDPGVRELDLYLRDDTLVAKTNVRDEGGNVQSTLVAIDTLTNAVRWTQATPVRINDNLVLLKDRVIVTRVDQGNIPTLNVDAYMLATGELRSIPMPMLETTGASLSAIDGPHPLLFIVSAESALTVVDVNTGAVVGTQPASETPPEIRFRQLPVIPVGGDAPVFVQPNGTWFRIGPE